LTIDTYWTNTADLALIVVNISEKQR